MSGKKEKLVGGLSIIGLALIAVIWGFSFVVMKDAVSAAPVFYVLAIRFTLSALPLSLIFMKKFRTATKRDYVRGVILGLVIAASYIAQSYGCFYTTASKNALLTAVYTVFVPFVTWVLFKKRPKLYSIVFAVLAFCGIAFICLDGVSAFNLGDMLTLLCGVLFAVQISLLSKFTEETDPIFLTIMEFVVAAVVCWSLSPIGGAFPTYLFVNPSLLWRILFLGLVCTLICFLLQSICQKQVKDVTSGLLMSLESFFGALAGIIFMHDPIYARLFIGCAMLAVAIVGQETIEPIIARIKKRKRITVIEPPSDDR